MPTTKPKENTPAVVTIDDPPMPAMLDELRDATAALAVWRNRAKALDMARLATTASTRAGRVHDERKGPRHGR